ncbi:MAG TPA: Hint domain-containing protein [Oligoflexus sp.]|uniref:Hint domain-containing protein n=1 Tax=Oligoflexus sp. TaxID=1971216 RepID=UPI002D6892E9|nr:Hint domain-containing protein [Oligoflexus sp.]HYX36249.1 Hint domain-containing protein [Oligoflexus sp.]
MKCQRETGNLSLGIILIGGIMGLTTLMSQNKKVEQSLQTSHVRKLSLESEELSLYAFTVVRQLFANTTGQAGLELANSFDPDTLADIRMTQVTPAPNNKVKIVSARDLIVFAPDLLTQETSRMNGLFEATNFNSLDRKLTPIAMQIVDFEPYPSGYGVKSLIFESKIELTVQNQKKLHTSRARIPVPLPPAACQITVQGQAGNGPVTIKQTTAAQPIAINATCSGTLLAVYLDVNQIQVAQSLLPQTLSPVFTDHMLSSPGQYELRVRASRVDESVVVSVPFVLFVEGPTVVSSKTDYMKCLYKCGCEWPAFAEPNLCAGSSDFVNPFHNMRGLTALPEITGNPITDAASRNILGQWAYDRGALNENETHGTKLQGLLYPSNGYGSKLACSKVGGGGKWLTWAFDPNNNCQEEFIGSRGTIGCLAEGSLVMTGPGRYKPIESLTREDRIWNPKLQRHFAIKKLVHGMESKDLHVITVGGKSLTMTYDHPVLTQRGYLQAAHLSGSDRLWIGSQLQPITEHRVQKQASASTVWNLVVDDATTWDEHLIFVEGVAVGDLWMQEQLSRAQGTSLTFVK